MTIRSCIRLWLMLAVLGASTPALARGGLIFGIDIGGAAVWGDTSMAVESGSVCWFDNLAKHTRSDMGSGFATGLRLGYNVMGYGALDISVLAHGGKDDNDWWEGQGHAGIRLFLYPLQFLALVPKLKDKLKDRKLDGSLYFGYGFWSMGGYHYDADSGRGWTGQNLQWGATFDYRLSDTVSVGLDLRFIRTMWSEYICEWSPRRESDALDASSFVMAPMATFTFHLWDPHK